MTNSSCEANSVVACVDGSEHTPAVMDAAFWAANQLQSAITILHAHDKSNDKKAIDYSGSIGMDSNQHLLESLSNEDLEKNTRMREQGKCIIDDAKSYILKENELAPFQPKIQKLHRHETLKNCVKNLSDDVHILVLGQDGTDKTNGNVGSQLEAIIRASTFPVLVVNKDYKSPKKVLLAFDNRQHSRAIIKWLNSHCLLKHAEIHLLYVADETEENQEDLRLAVSKLKKNGLDVVSEIKPGIAKEVLVQYQKDMDIDMLIMGAYGHSRIHEFIMGSTTDYLLMHNVNSILMMRSN